MDGIYPRMMYRPGSEMEWEGRNLDTCTVESEDEEQAKAAEGWSTCPRISPVEPA